MVQLNYDVYTVGWLCVLPCEVNASRAVLDEVHESLPCGDKDENNYILGQVNGHNIVIGFPGLGMYGTHNASTVAIHMRRTFHKIRFGLMVGIGGGVPRISDPTSPLNDMRLGDVVVSNPKGSHGGVLQYDMGRWKDEGLFHISSHSNKPPPVLLRAAEKLQVDHVWEVGQMENYVNQVLQKVASLPRLKEFQFPGWEQDQLFESAYEHRGGEDCTQCEPAHLVQRLERPSKGPAVHYGLIASGNAVMRSAFIRDELRDKWNISCFEMEAAGLMDHFSCIVIRGICDYSDSHKNKVWQPYAAITAAAYAKDLLRVIHPEDVKSIVIPVGPLNKIAGTLDRVGEEVSHLAISVKEHQKTEILNWLHPYDFGAEQSDIFCQARKGTGQWLLDSKDFQSWLNNEAKTLLCQGIPGAGKTVMASIIIDHLMTRYQGTADVNIIYIFCNFRRRQDQTVTELLTLLLKQAAWKHSGLPAGVARLHAQFLSRGIRPSSADIASALEEVLSIGPRGFIVIDALDEMLGSNQDGTEFLLKLFELQHQSGVNVLATSRHVTEIENEFRQQESTFIEISANIEDLHSYLDDQMRHLPPFVSQTPGLISETKSKIIEAADGMFLLARLHLDSLQEERTVSGFRSALMSLPKGSDAADAAFSEAMGRIRAQNKASRDIAMGALSWIVSAMRPLKTTELQHALSVTRGHEELNESDNISTNRIISACSGLVAIDMTSEIIRLVHYTLQEWFERTTAAWFPDAHDDIGRTCMKYLSLDIWGPQSDANDENFKIDSRRYALLNYAAENWGHHAKKAPVDHPLVMATLNNDLVKDTSAQSLEILQKIPVSVVEPDLLRKKPRNMGMTRLHMAAYFGLVNPMLEFIGEGDECNTEDFWGRTPLSWAAYGGQADVVNTMLKSGADPGQLDYWGNVPLSCAADRGHEDVVLAFLSRITDPYRLITAYGYIMSSVIRTGNTRLQKLVHNVVVLRDYRTFHSQSLLSEAAYHCNWTVVKMLLEEGFDPNTRDYGTTDSFWARSGSTPLMWAALTGQNSTIRLLLESGAEPRATDDSGRNVLSYAAEGGFAYIIRLFVEMGHRSLLHGVGGTTALCWAALKGHNSVIRLLIDLNVEKDGPDNHGRRAIARAAEGSHLSSVKLLIDLGLNPCLLNSKSGWKGLHWAIDASNEPLVRLLLQNKDDPNLRDENHNIVSYEWGPLIFAAQTGHVGVMKALLEHGARPLDGRDCEWGRSPISKAASWGRSDMIKLLIEEGIHPDLEDQAGSYSSCHEHKTPLMWASAFGEEQVVEILLQNGANPNTEDCSNNTPMTYAIWHDQVNIVSHLIKYGGKLDNRNSCHGNCGQSMLSVSSQYGYKAMVKLLLDKGADPNWKDDDGQSPLMWASKMGHSDIMRVLRDYGAF